MMSTNSPVRVKKIKRQAQALRLRIDGKTYKEIGESLGVHKTTALRLVSSALAEMGVEIAKDREQLRHLLGARLESLIGTFMPKAELGDARAAAVVVSVLSRLARLYGLDEPTRLDANVRTDGLDLSQMSEGQIRQHCRHLGIPVGDDPPQTSNPQGA